MLNAAPRRRASPLGRGRCGCRARPPCAGCYGSDGKGSPLGPDLTSGHWIWGDGSLTAIAYTINVGVPRPQKYGAPMPPMGGAQLSPSE
jgi:hypothetical protein